MKQSIGYALALAAGVIGAVLLMIFTLLASGVHHRFWQMEDPMKRTYHFLLITNNSCIFGGLLLLV